MSRLPTQIQRRPKIERTTSSGLLQHPTIHISYTLTPIPVTRQLPLHQTQTKAIHLQPYHNPSERVKPQPRCANHPSTTTTPSTVPTHPKLLTPQNKIRKTHQITTHVQLPPTYPTPTIPKPSPKNQFLLNPHFSTTQTPKNLPFSTHHSTSGIKERHSTYTYPSPEASLKQPRFINM